VLRKTKLLMPHRNIRQRDLFDSIEDSYIQNKGKLKQNELYALIEKKFHINPEDCYHSVSGQRVNIFRRRIRYIQQTLKAKNLLRRVDDSVWEVTGAAAKKLQVIQQGKCVLAMSTSLGIMVCTTCESFFDSDSFTGEIDLVITSPPYALINPRNYPSPEPKEWVSFIMGLMKRVIPRLAKGGSIALQVGVDTFEPNTPARTIHIERLICAMDDAGMSLIDRHIWLSNKMPNPIQYTSINRMMLKSSYELLLHWSNDPWAVQSDNRRVLQDHTDTHRKFVINGGTQKPSKSGDGANDKRVGDYSGTDLTKGRIPSNAYYFANKCKANESVNRFADQIGVPRHGAKFPANMVSFLLDYFCPKENALVMDICSGSGTVASECERKGLNWIALEPVKEFCMQSFTRFTTLTDDIYINPEFFPKVS
jgi:DNA modification methylase